MSNYQRSVWAVVIALVVIFVGLFLVCAQRRGTVAGGNNMANNDEQFRQELLQLLDLTEDESGADTSSANTQLAGSGDEADTTTLALSDDEMLALLGGENESGDEAAAANNKTAAGQNVLETKPTTTTATMGLTPEMFAKMNKDISRLEADLELRSATVDSLQNIITNRNTRLKELEAQQASRKTAPVATQTARNPVQSGSSAGSSVFNSAYESARSKFESHSYQAAINEFEKLLADYPEHRMADNCQYWIGECYFGLKEYQKAVVEFQKVFAYSEIDKHDDAQLMIGLSYVRSGQKDQAQKEFGSFLNNFAGSEYASVAKRYYRNI